MEMVVPDLAAGDFEHLTITGQLGVIEDVVRDEPVVLMGSSLGGYLAALYAARHASVRKVVLMAPAFCFPRRFAANWRGTDTLEVFHYGLGKVVNLSYGLIEDAAQYEDYPDFDQPALIFHGVHDTVVPVELSENFAAEHPNAKLRAVESDHELVDVLNLMLGEIREFLFRE